MPFDVPVYLLAGPTASGKSAKALEWAEATGGVIVNADSMQLYRDVPTLTARPSPEDETRAQHHLYGHLGPQDQWSTGDWIRAAKPFIDAALNGGPKLCVTGGTGLYFLSLIRGLAQIPEISDPVRHRARALYADEGEASVRASLRRHDPQSEARIMPHDAQRLSRALEVWLETGVSLSDWQTNTAPLLPDGSYHMDILLPERETLYARCDSRLVQMIKAGALDEVRSLMAQNYCPDWPISRVLGLNELASHLSGDMTLPDALCLAQQKTRNYAKRQMTFFRNQFTGQPRI